MYIDRTVRHKYVLKSILQIENPDKQTFHIAPLPQMIIPKGMASESYRGTIQTDGYEVYEAYENAPGKRMIGCWAHARRKFVEAMDESKKHASEIKNGGDPLWGYPPAYTLNN